VREALRLLASQHLIVTTRGVAGGSFVNHPSPSQLSDTLATGVRLLRSTSVVTVAELLEVRAMVEIPAAGLAAARRQDADVAAMRAAMFDPAGADLATMLEAHPAFHRALARACGNTLLELVIHPLHSIINDREIAERPGRDFWVRVDADHRAILDAVAAGDVAGAEAASARHLAHLRETFAAEDETSAAERATRAAQGATLAAEGATLAAEGATLAASAERPYGEPWPAAG
jgi:DNA-binding FadR family transcriptional regulator